MHLLTLLRYGAPAHAIYQGHPQANAPDPQAYYQGHPQANAPDDKRRSALRPPPPSNSRNGQVTYPSAVQAQRLGGRRARRKEGAFEKGADFPLPPQQSQKNEKLGKLKLGKLEK